MTTIKRAAKLDPTAHERRVRSSQRIYAISFSGAIAGSALQS
jgi:hypothetical protein